MAKDSALSALNGLREGHGLKTEIVSPPNPSKKKRTSKVSSSSPRPVFKSKKGSKNILFVEPFLLSFL